MPAQVRASQLEVPAEHFARAPCGSPSIGVQLPNFPLTSHASHWPSHADSQHTPSTQCPEAHSGSSVHTEPRFFEQTPGFSGLPQLSPTPHTATPQQAPSVQSPVVHVEALVHGVPRPSTFAHAPPLQ